MGSKAILILLLVAAALGVTLYLTDAKTTSDEVAEASVLGGRSLSNATRLRWEFEGQQAVELGHAADGRFELKEPIVDIASAAYLKQIVHSWDSAQMRAVPFADDEEGRKRAGLDPPELHLIAEWDDGKRIDVEVGASGPLGSTRFLRINDKIWEGGAALIESMRVGLNDLRERQVFRHAFGAVRQVTLDQLLPSGKRETLDIHSVGGEWQLQSPVTGRADPVAAKRFVTAVVSLRVDHFQPGAVRIPSRTPDIKIAIAGAFGEEAVDVWLEQGQIWGLLPGRGHIFTSNNQQYGQVFVNAANNLRSRILVPMGESTYEELVELIVDPGQGRGDRIRLRRESQTSAWKMLEPIEYEVRATPVNESAYALQQLVAREFVSEDGVRPRAEDPRYGLQGARWTVSTRRARANELQVLWFGKDVVGGDEAAVFCCRSDEPDNVVVVQKIPFDVLRRSWLVYCDRQIMKQPGVIERLDLEHKDGRKRSFESTGEVWSLVGVEGDRSEVGEFANDILRDFVGKKAVDMRDGFEGPDWTLTMMRRNGDELGLIKVWDAGDELPLICKGRKEAPVGFEVNKSNSRDLRAMWK
jgi:hypothetical protein